MPEMNGFEASQAIRDLEKAKGMTRTPIIAVTAHALIGDKQRCLDVGMNDYLSKPLHIERLAEYIEKWYPVETPDALSASKIRI